MEVTEFLEAVTGWVKQRHDICALALVGSWARGNATKKSDVDLVILGRRPAELLQDEDWTRQFGDVVTSRKEQYGVMTSIRVHYASGIEAEFAIATRSWASIPLDPDTRRVISDGMRVLHDPDRLLEVALNEVSA